MTQMTERRFNTGDLVIFKPKAGESSWAGCLARVVISKNDNFSDESGASYGIKFADQHKMWAFPQELTPVSEFES